MRTIRSIVALAGLVPVLALTGSAGPALARPAGISSAGARSQDRSASELGSPGFRVAVSRHYGKPVNASGYSVIIVTGRDQVWAFGGTNPGGPSLPVAARWNGRTMIASTLPAGLAGFITEASAPAASDIWAASSYGRYLLHWNGARWALARQWHSGVITDVDAVSARNVWVFGTSPLGTTGTGTWHFNGRSWYQVHGLGATICRASAVSRRDIWGISAGSSGDSVVHYTGRNWHRVRTGRALEGVQLTDILATSPSDVWVLGDTHTDGTVRLVLVHWDGTDWSRLPSSVQAWPGRLAPGPDGSVLISATPTNGAADGLILRATTRGWRPMITLRSPLGSGVSDIALMRSTKSLWASGGVLNRVGGDAVIWEGPARWTPHRAAARWTGSDST
jgi:hypothetical protein